MVAGLGELSTPREKLMMERDPNRADVATRPTETAGMREFRVGLWIASGRQHGTDRSRSRDSVAVSAASSVDRACVETRAAADTSQGFAKGRTGEKGAATVVDDDDMELLRGFVGRG